MLDWLSGFTIGEIQMWKWLWCRTPQSYCCVCSFSEGAAERTNQAVWEVRERPKGSPECWSGKIKSSVHQRCCLSKSIITVNYHHFSPDHNNHQYCAAISLHPLDFSSGKSWLPFVLHPSRLLEKCSNSWLRRSVSYMADSVFALGIWNFKKQKRICVTC